MKLFDIQPYIITLGPEPSLRDVVLHYYLSHGMEASKAHNLTSRYEQALLKEYTEATGGIRHYNHQVCKSSNPDDDYDRAMRGIE